jgi:hypothetical protein
MGGETSRTKSQSLGDLLATLRCGDPCPWCGTRLEAGSVLRRVDEVASTAPDSQVSGTALVCPDCGSEVYTASGAAQGCCRGSLGAAA